MGAARRRKAEIDSLKRRWPRHISMTAVHEAGHIVARFITAKTMGVDPHEAVWSVEMYEPDTALKLARLDGRLRNPTTWGPMYSAAIEAVSNELDTKYGLDIEADPDRAMAVISSEHY